MSEARKPTSAFLDKLDRIPVGFIVGLLVPVLTFLAYYKAIYSSFEFSEFLLHIRSRHTLAAFVKVSVFGNLPVFLIFNILKRFLICYGIFYSSMIYILLIFYLKFLA